MLPLPVDIENLRDEASRGLKPQAQHTLCAGAFTVEGHIGLYANDAKGSRRWLWNQQACASHNLF
jgi:hypothetical protein